MNKDSLEQAVATITSALQDRSTNQITGALLGELIRRVAPDLNIRQVTEIQTGPGALSRFIIQHLPHVLVRSHKQGSDVVYSIKGNSASSPHVDADPEVWRAFVRPNSSRQLIIRNSGLDLVAKSEINEGRVENASVIQSATLAELDQIRSDYASSLKENGETLPSINAPYNEWSVALRKLGRDYYSQWTAYRLKKIEELFNARLEALNVPSEIRLSVWSVMRRSQLAAKAVLNNPKSLSEVPPNLDTRSLIRVGGDEDDLRAAMVRIVQHMPVEELRNIKLSFGAMFDALIRQQTK